ncbi:MAG TPA: NUDIX domain-containing protein [Streptosporangiaceae bacterium]|nr:NUDIX domain-containing protein [Streptosporangiaceae bacterium]
MATTLSFAADSTASGQLLADVRVGLLLTDRNSILLLEQGGAADSSYTLPMGSVQRGESVIQALMRIAEREVGVLIDADDLRLGHVMHSVGVEEELRLFFTATTRDGQGFSRDSERASTLDWFPSNQLPPGLAGADRTVVELCDEGRAFSIYPDPCPASATPRSYAARAVGAFHAAFGLPMQERPDVDVDEGLASLRVDLLEEEVQEFIHASKMKDLTGIADALADIMYVVYGTALTYGIDLDLVLHEVHRSNMSKLDANGTPILRADGKVQKSSSYFRPRISEVLAEQPRMRLP